LGGHLCLTVLQTNLWLAGLIKICRLKHFWRIPIGEYRDSLLPDF
jgi:hypothetical protein